MGEMVDRIAQAQAGIRWEQFNNEQKEAARELARIAIGAMREPTRQMLVYSMRHMESFSENLLWWQRMIDQAGK